MPLPVVDVSKGDLAGDVLRPRRRTRVDEVGVVAWNVVVRGAALERVELDGNAVADADRADPVALEANRVRSPRAVMDHERDAVRAQILVAQVDFKANLEALRQIHALVCADCTDQIRYIRRDHERVLCRVVVRIAVERHKGLHLVGVELAANIDVDGTRNRWSTRLVEDEEHPVAGRRDIRVVRELDTNLVAVYLEGQIDLTLIHVERMGRVAELHKRDARDLCAIVDRDVEVGMLGHLRRTIEYGGSRRQRPVVIEQVVWRVDLTIEVGQRAGRTAAGG